MIDYADILPSEVSQFILEQIHSVEQLEILILLFLRRGDALTVNQIDEQIRTSSSSILLRLDDLEKRGLALGVFIGEAKSWGFSESEESKRILSILVKYYPSHRSRIIELIYSRPPEAIG